MATKSDPNGLLHGTLDALVLKTLARGPLHGYGIAKWIEEATAEAVVVEEGSLYPALYRMERREWIEAEWGTSELGRQAKFYRDHREGTASARQTETQQWARFAAGVSKMLLAGEMTFGQRLRSRFWKPRVEDEVDAEFDFHVEMRTRELVGAGHGPGRGPRAPPSSRFGDINQRQSAACRSALAGRRTTTCVERNTGRSSARTSRSRSGISSPSPDSRSSRC